MSLLDKKNTPDRLEGGTLQSNVKRSKFDIGIACYKKIKEDIVKLGDTCGNLLVVQAEFQADLVLAWSILNNKADILLSLDSDLAALLGHRCISIKKFSFNNWHYVKTLKDTDIFSANDSVIQDIVQHVHLPVGSIVPANRPLFEYVNDKSVCFLIAVGIGCDVLVSVVQGMTPKNTMNILTKMRKNRLHECEFYDTIMKKYLECYSTYRRKLMVNKT
jgi:hypothetical protein